MPSALTVGGKGGKAWGSWYGGRVACKLTGELAVGEVAGEVALRGEGVVDLQWQQVENRHRQQGVHRHR